MAWLERGERIPDPTLEEQYHAIIGHYKAMLDHYDNHTGVNMARKHIGWYTKGLTGSAEFRHAVNQEPDAAKVLDMLAGFYAPLIASGADATAMRQAA